MARFRDLLSAWRGPVTAEGAGVSLLAQMVRSIVALVAVPLTIGYLGTEVYGLWTVTLSVLSVLTVMDAGLSPAAKNRMAQAFAVKDARAFNAYASAMLVLGGGVALVGLVALPVVALVDWGGALALVSEGARAQATPFVVSTGAVVFASFALAGVEAIYAARLRVGAVAATAIAASVASLGLVWAASSVRAPLWMFPIAMTGPSVCGRAVMLVLLWREDPRQVVCTGKHATSIFKELLPDSSAFVALQGASIVIGAAPNVLLAAYSGIESVTRFNIALQLASAPLMLIAAVMPAYWPAFTVAWTRREIPELRATLGRAVAVTAVMLVAYAVALSFVGDTLAFAWTRGQVHVSRSALVVLGAWVVVQGVAHWLSTFLNAISDLRIQVVCMVTQAASLVGLAALAPATVDGVPLAVAMFVAAALTWTLPLSLRVRRRLGTNDRVATRGVPE